MAPKGRFRRAIYTKPLTDEQGQGIFAFARLDTIIYSGGIRVHSAARVVVVGPPGIVLLQLAPSTPYDPDLLQKVLLAFPDPSQVAVEFRHPLWVTTHAAEELREILFWIRSSMATGAQEIYIFFTNNL